MGALTFVTWAKNSYGLELTLEKSRELRALWFDAYPEMKLHLKPPKDSFALQRNIAKFCRQYKLKPARDTISLRTMLEDKGCGKKDIDTQIRKMTYYIGRTITGLNHYNLDYCSACNFPFQALSAQGLKEALWLLYLDGFEICNEIHDEVLIYHKEDNNLQENIKRVEKLMIEGMRKVCPDVTIKCESTLMRKWSKKAQPIFNSSGDLLVWEPED